MTAMKDRKYRQLGYQQSSNESQARRETPSASQTPGMVKRQTVSRCADCGTLLPAQADPFGHCPHCRSELHSCRQCAYFDPAHRFECTEPIPERIPNKRARNECLFFSLHVTVERTTTSGSVRPEDAQHAFKNLFKK